MRWLNLIKWKIVENKRNIHTPSIPSLHTSHSIVKKCATGSGSKRELLASEYLRGGGLFYRFSGALVDG